MTRNIERILLINLAAVTLCAEVRLPALISDHMLLQQGVPIRIWGWADPGEAVTVAVSGQKVSVTAGADGKWLALLQPLTAGPAAEMTVQGANRITIHDVLVGEVWLASGQSNMGLNVATAADAANEIAHANYPDMRLFRVGMAVPEKPTDDVKGAWVLCTPESVKTFSAAAYYFGRNLLEARKTPIGLIESAVGGTGVEAWMRDDILQGEPAFHYVFDEWQKKLDAYPAAKVEYDKKVAEWKKASAAAKAAGTAPPDAPKKPDGPGHPRTPSGLYNGMIAPLLNYAIRGAIWYQGEQNGSEMAHALIYRREFAAMIEDWRKQFGQGDFPFLFVQLPNIGSKAPWTTLRESQAKTLALRNTGMAVTIDVGEARNIHPKNKQDVGKRLALIARATVYGEKVEYSGPAFRKAASEGAAMRVQFDHAEGLTARGGADVAGFEIAGADRKFVPAKAAIQGGAVVLTADGVAKPVAVRYAWANDPHANLVNAADLPAAPFRSDDW